MGRTEVLSVGIDYFILLSTFNNCHILSFGMIYLVLSEIVITHVSLLQCHGSYIHICVKYYTNEEYKAESCLLMTVVFLMGRLGHSKTLRQEILDFL